MSNSQFPSSSQWIWQRRNCGMTPLPSHFKSSNRLWSLMSSASWDRKAATVSPVGKEKEWHRSGNVRHTQGTSRHIKAYQGILQTLQEVTHLSSPHLDREPSAALHGNDLDRIQKTMLWHRHPVRIVLSAVCKCGIVWNCVLAPWYILDHLSIISIFPTGCFYTCA
jgi:hypothetical protein